MKELRKSPGRFMVYLLFTSLAMATGWGTLLWYLAAPVVGVILGVLIFVVVFSAFWFAENHALNDLDELYNRRFDD